MDENDPAKIFLQGEHESYWIESTTKTNYPLLEKDIETDVAVIGGGITGLTAAYLLKQKGKKVIILEARKIAEGVTGYTTAKITSLHTLIYSHLVKQFGGEKAKKYGEAQEEGLKFISDLVDKYKIDCDFQRVPAYTFAWNEEQEQKVKEEAAVALSLGLSASFVPQTDLPFETKGAVRFNNQARFHPRKYLLKLADLIVRENNYIFEKSRVVDIKEGKVMKIVTKNAEVKAKDIIIATNYPILERSIYVPRLTSLRSYVLGAYVKDTIPDGMYISADKPIFSIRLQPTSKGNMTIITGEEHKTGDKANTISFYRQLEEITKKYLKTNSIDYYWSTQDVYTIDMVPFIGKYSPHSKNLYLATGFGGWGMTNGTIAGIILSDMVLEEKNPWQEVFDPARIEQIKSAKKILSQNFSMVKNVIGGKLSRGEKISITKMKKNEGKIINSNGEKIAVYKDKNGNVVCLTPICTHLGCQVNFNNAETSWDCPCHGSRFNVDGEVIQGPAVKPLEKK